MNTTRKQNAVFAFLDEYKKAINELKFTIAELNEKEITEILDKETLNPECSSIQRILTHVISSGYSYCIYIQNHRNINSIRPEQKFRSSAKEYLNDLDNIIAFTNETFSNIYDDELEEFNGSDKIATKWGQAYDIEQMLEHSIVHILRHRRQIENFKKKIQRS